MIDLLLSLLCAIAAIGIILAALLAGFLLGWAMERIGYHLDQRKL